MNKSINGNKENYSLDGASEDTTLASMGSLFLAP